MKIGIYALAKNESKRVASWAASTEDADIVVVTDTGSTDDTVPLLSAAGVEVVRGAVCPWRWDDAHNLSLNHLPAGVDIAIRLDLDETLAPGWREVVERAWVEGTTQVRYQYAWSPELSFYCDRIHSRRGYRWQAATHEGLVRWDGEERIVFVDDVLVRHHRDAGKRHSTDLHLLRRAAAEAPHDARVAWYLARELDYAGDEGAAAAFKRYLDLEGGTPPERAHSCRQLSLLEPQAARLWLMRSILESPREPDGYLRLAHNCHARGDAVGALHYARAAAECDRRAMSHASEPGAYGPYPCVIAAEAALSLGLRDEAAAHAKQALARDPSRRDLASIADGGVLFDLPGPRPN